MTLLGHLGRLPSTNDETGLEDDDLDLGAHDMSGSTDDNPAAFADLEQSDLESQTEDSSNMNSEQVCKMTRITRK